MERRIASESKQTVRGGPKPAKVGLHRRLGFSKRQYFFLYTYRRNLFFFSLDGWKYIFFN